MPEFQRRHFVHTLSLGLGGLALGMPTAPLWAQSSNTVTSLGPKLRIVIPANTRTALDFTGRALGDGFVGVGVCDEVEYENIDGRGGSTALETYVKKYAADPNTFLVGGMALLSSTAAYKSAIDITKVKPIARLTSASLVVVVAKDSPLRSMNDLVLKLRSTPKQVVIGGGLLASEDHLLSGLMVRAAKQKVEDVTYTPFNAGFQMIEAVSQGKVTAAISGYGIFREDLVAGRLRALAISSKKATDGIKSMREQGVDVDLTNWRGVFTGAAVPAPRQLAMVEGVRAATGYLLYEKTLKEFNWDSAWMSGPNFASFVDIENKTTQLMAQLLKLG
jgi:putative tricarboxylic transport membrane protein